MPLPHSGEPATRLALQREFGPGSEFPVDADWASLAGPGPFEPLVHALSAVAADDLGQSALREGLSKIVVRNAGGFYSTSGISFDDGVLTFDHRPDANIGDGEERAKGLQRILESAL